MRVGIGYDVHKFAEGRKLILGGVEIPYEKGLLGHSDADVIVHAIMDALLGAAALGDIGQHFPDTDPEYEGISSITLLEKVGGLLDEHNYVVGNIDSIIIAQKPKMMPHLLKMRQNVADALHIDIAGRSEGCDRRYEDAGRLRCMPRLHKAGDELSRRTFCPRHRGHEHRFDKCPVRA